MERDGCGVSYAHSHPYYRLANPILTAPANDYITYKSQSFNLDEVNQAEQYFTPYPSAKTEEAWANLFESKFGNLSEFVPKLLNTASIIQSKTWPYPQKSCISSGVRIKAYCFPTAIILRLLQYSTIYTAWLAICDGNGDVTLLNSK